MDTNIILLRQKKEHQELHKHNLASAQKIIKLIALSLLILTQTISPVNIACVQKVRKNKLQKKLCFQLKNPSLKLNRTHLSLHTNASVPTYRFVLCSIEHINQSNELNRSIWFQTNQLEI